MGIYFDECLTTSWLEFPGLCCGHKSHSSRRVTLPRAGGTQPCQGLSLLITWFPVMLPSYSLSGEVETVNCPDTPGCFPHSIPGVQPEISLGQPGPCACLSWLAGSGTVSQMVTLEVSQSFKPDKDILLQHHSLEN